MKNHSEFKIGRKYRHASFIRTCVGFTTKGHAILEAGNSILSAVVSPEEWIEHREPREYWIVNTDQCGYVHGTLGGAEYFAEKAGGEIIHVREIIK